MPSAEDVFNLSSRSHFDTLDGLRGIAAFIVLYHHLENTAATGTYFARLGFLSVDLFFILSGFVVVYSYDDALKTKMSLWSFVTRRLIRLYPLTLMGIVLTALLLLPAEGVFQTALTNMLFIPELWRSGNVFGANAIQWTLFFELFANIVYAAAIAYMVNWAVAGIVIISAVALYFTGQSYGSLGLGWATEHFFAGFARVGFGFFTGVLIFRLWRWQQGKISLPCLPAWLIVLAFLVALMLPDRLGIMTWRVQFFEVCVVFPLIIWLGAQATYGDKTRRFFSWLGRVSFPIYALQTPIREFAEPFVRSLPVSTITENLIMVAIVTSLSWTALVMFDEPLRRYLSVRFTARRNRVEHIAVP